MVGDYQRACDEAIRSPDASWNRAAEAIQWHGRDPATLDEVKAALEKLGFARAAAG
jgi:hypothetical protein